MEDYSPILDKISKPVATGFQKYAQQAAGVGMNVVKQFFGTMTEPFFRKGMGHRYYPPGNFLPGLYVWFLAGCLSAGFAPSASVLAILAHLNLFAHVRFIMQSPWLPFLAGIGMMILQWRAGVRNLQAVAEHRRKGLPLHTRSRGAAVWKNEGLAALRFQLILSFFSWPMAVVFTIGYGMNSKLKSAQDIAIQAAYWDAVDKEIENNFLKPAALGECPSEITYLYNPLDKNLDPQVRKDMAAAIVGEPVSVVAKPPRKKGSQQSQSQPKPSATAQSEWEEREPEWVSENPAEAASKPVTEGELYGDSPLEQLRKRFNQNCEPIFGPACMGQKRFEQMWNLGKLVRRFATTALVIAIGTAIVVFTVRFVQSHHKSKSALITTEMKQSAEPGVQSQVQPAAPPVVQPPADDHAALDMQAKQVQLAKEKAAQLLEQARQERLNNERLAAQAINLLVNQIKVATTNENAALDSFAVQGNSFWLTVSNRIAKLPHRRQADLWEQTEIVHTTFQNLVVADQGLLEKIQAHYPNMTSSTKSKLQVLLESLTANFAKVETNRQTVFNEMAQLDASITEAEKKRGFWPF